MKRIFSILLFTILIPIYLNANDLKAVVSPEPKYYAWWLRITFMPEHKELYGVPLNKIDPTWMLASQLKKEAIPREVLFESGEDEMAARGIDFMQKGDFNSDNIEDLALVGVFQNLEKEQGMFFLILTKDKNDLWKKTFLQSWLGKPGFLGLQKDGGCLALLFCMDCGGVSEVTWDKKLKRYQIQKPADEET
ncbi:MAG TPA: hypothetical protein PLR34_09140 [Bacteroidales bacterium]|nr:hypothetical protein [Smithella sp.]OQC71384.1 MAG: hypothetical protein BWX45_01189 [Deltaproteobacteria bacterium ADurb.Bin002]HOD63741.1 hypothetical protein [Smithellaceae bacterium]HQM99305.1 hypothetical protein [Bacteroidales bacterium]HOE21882.1 hypothetical protein [Smithellaceae bacterium]